MNNSSNTNESLIQKVIDNSDIVEVIGEYINLEKKGNDYKGLCPFHNDSNPSLSVSPQKKVFKCFSCNAAGNVISFVQRIENISFMDALKKVANKSGIKLNLKENPHEQRRQKYYKILNDATSAYEFYLHNTNEGKKALEYLEKRHISLDVIKKFRIGLSSHNENIICKVLLEQNKYLPIDLKEVGLIDDDTNGKEVDLFHGRIMFPITDLKGNVVGFSGRVYDRESNSKYLNTKENEIFKKKEILFNYSSCVNDIKMLNHVFVFEGFMDVIACYRAGINNAIATMGTSLTENQVEIISSLTNNITLCYDGDNPGIEASKRAIKMFMKKNISLSSIVLPEGLDPDDYINKFGYGKKTGIDLNGESSGILFNLDKVGPVELATTAFGQGVSVTAIQQVAAVSAAINGGTLYKPYIVKRITEHETGQIIKEIEPTKVRENIVTKETSEKVRMTLESVVSLGTGRNAYIDGYRVGGKTGTAQKVNNGVYMHGNYIVSFIGFMPANDPKVVVYLAIDNPKGVTQYGGTVSAPIVKNILEDAISALNIKKQEGGTDKKYQWYDQKYYTVEDVVGLTKKEAASKLKSFTIEYSGSGDKVINQSPEAGSRIPEYSSIRLYLD